MKAEKIKSVEILDFEKQIGIELDIRENDYWDASQKGLKKWSVFWSMASDQGNGDTINEAMDDIAKKISGKIICLSDHETVVTIPNLIHTINIIEPENHCDGYDISRYITPMTQHEAAVLACRSSKELYGSNCKSKEFMDGFAEGVMSLYFEKFACRTIKNKDCIK